MNNHNLGYVISIFGTDYIEANKSTGEIAYNCPFCEELGHSKHNDYKLYVNVNSLVYYCFRCESKGHLRSELSDEFENVDVLGVLSDYFKKDDSNADEESSFFALPKSRVVDYKDSEGYKYLHSRGFTDDDMDKYSIRIPDLNHMYLSGRVIIPNKIISKNWTDFYVARSYLGHDNRYKNPNTSRKSELLFNYHNIPDNPEYLILNEGALNSIVAGDLSVASFGKSISHDQIMMILDKNPKKIYVSYDTDAIKQAKNVCTEFRALSSIPIYLVELPYIINNDGEMKGLDAVDLGRDRYLDIVFNSNEFISSELFDILHSI